MGVLSWLIKAGLSLLSLGVVACAAGQPGAGSQSAELPADPLAAAQQRIQELEQQNRELTALNTIVRSMNYRLNLQRFLNDALREVIAALNVKVGALYLRSGENMLLGAMLGLPRELVPTMATLDALQTGELLRLRVLDAQQEIAGLPFVAPAGVLGICSWLAVALNARDLQAGLLLIGAEEAGRFGAREVDLVSSIADQLAIAVENACLFEETWRSLRRLEAMNRASQMINASLDLTRVLQSLAQYACELASADGAAIYEWDADHHMLQVGIGYKLRPWFIQSLNSARLSTPIAADAVREAVETHRPAHIPDAVAAPSDAYSELYRSEGYRAFLAVPMLQGNDTLGVIGLWWRQAHHTPADVIALLTTLANQSVGAIENARLNAFNEQIVQSMHEGVLIQDAEGKITFANPRMAELLGYMRAEDLIGQPFLSCVDPTDRFLAHQQQGAARAGQSRRYETRFQTHEGRVLPVLVSSTPLVERRTGRHSGILTVVTDLSEVKQLQARLFQTEKLSALGELIAGVAHELNNPLTSIIGYAQLIQAHHMPADARADLERISRQAQRASEIVRNLLTFARREAPRRQYVDINEWIGRTIALRAYELRVQNIRVETDLSPTLPRTMADPHQLQQVFLNLILNAEQAIADAGVGSQITIRSWSEDGAICIEVSDNGPGIPPEIQQRIFDPFFTTKEQGKGTGLGLSICYGIVKEHGGRISVHSDGVYGEGASFRVTLPIVAGTPSEETGIVRGLAGEVAAALAREHILLVDDERDILELAKRALTEEGYQVDVATDGGQALERLQSSQYDLILCDVKMPGMGGAQFWDQLTSRDSRMAGRVVFVTGDVVGEETADLLRRTAAPSLQKPFDMDELSAMVRQMLDRERA
jgi:two-component system NtrC family sensor kinase